MQVPRTDLDTCMYRETACISRSLNYLLNILPWLVQDKSEAGTLAGTKFVMLIGRWIAVDFCHTKAIYDYYKSMVSIESFSF